MAYGILLILQIFLFHSTATITSVYNYNETSDAIPFNEHFLSGFRDVINKDFVIGGLFPVYDCTGTIGGDLEMLEAMMFALDRINNDISLLPNLTIGYDVRDTCNHALIALDEATHILRLAGDGGYNVLGIIGPASTSITRVIAAGLEQLQVPLIGYGSTSAILSNRNVFEYFLRTIPSTNLQANAMVDLVSHFGWEFVSVIFNDDDYGSPGSNAFIDQAMERKICIDTKISVPPLGDNYNEFSKGITKAAKRLLDSKASVVIVFTDALTAFTLFKELRNTNSTRKFMWIASDKWTNSYFIKESFPEIARGTIGFLPQLTKYVEEFNDYFSQLTPDTNNRDPFFNEFIFNIIFCDRVYYRVGPGLESGSGLEFGSGSGNGSGLGIGSGSGSGSGLGFGSGSGHRYEYRYECPDDLTKDPSYSQGDLVPYVIDAVYAFAHAIQDFLEDNCDSPLRWNGTTKQCDGMKHELNGENLLGYLFNVTFNGIQNYTVIFDENGDPSGAYEIFSLQETDNRSLDYVSVGVWDSVYKKNALALNNTDGIEEIDSICSKPCREGYVRSIAIQNCPSCFECIPCVGPTYSMNSSGTNCSLCSDNHWGNSPLSGSARCVPVEVRHLDYSSGWSITSMCIASITLIILAVITVIFVMTWDTPVVKSSGREEMIMLLIGIGACCVLTYIIVGPPSTGVCVFQRIGIWFCFSLAFGALLVKIIRVARIFYSIKSSAKRPRFTDPVHQVVFTIAIVAGQFLLVAIGLGVDPPDVERDPEVVITSSAQQTGEAPEIIETCQQPHTAILVLLLAYNFLIIVGCTILGLMTMGFPENFNEAKHVMFTSFTLMVIWVLFMPLYFYTEEEIQSGVLALGIVLSAVALMAGIFFPRVFIIIFQKHKNTKEYVQSGTGTGTTQATNFSKAFQRSKTLIIN